MTNPSTSLVPNEVSVSVADALNEGLMKIFAQCERPKNGPIGEILKPRHGTFTIVVPIGEMINHPTLEKHPYYRSDHAITLADTSSPAAIEASRRAIDTEAREFAFKLYTTYKSKGYKIDGPHFELGFLRLSITIPNPRAVAA